MILLNTYNHYDKKGATFSVRDGEISMKQRIYNEIERPPVAPFSIQPALCRCRPVQWLVVNHLQSSETQQRRLHYKSGAINKRQMFGISAEDGERKSLI